MEDRIRKLTEMTLKGDMYTKPVKTEFDRKDLFLSETEKDVKRLCEYLLNQETTLTPYSKMTGTFQFDDSVVGDAFKRGGHKATHEVNSLFYLKPLENLSTMEAQHATADYKRVLEIGLAGIIGEIEKSLERHSRKEEVEFLTGLKKVAQTLIAWACKCSEKTLEFSRSVEDETSRKNLERLSAALLQVPKKAPTSFYEAVLSIYVCFSANEDSVGPLDRYLNDFYEKDIRAGLLTREEAKEYLQELFLMIQAKTPKENPYFTRGGQSHFCVGGYLENGEDGCGDITRLIVESLTELPIYIPQVTFRWTEKTSHEDFKFMMDCERKDPHKRIAFANDDKRLKCFTENCHIPFERAVNFTLTGCNEPAFAGAITGSNSKGNILHSVETVFHRKAKEIIDCGSFEEFYKIYEREMFADFDIIYDYDDKYNLERAKDVNYISSLFFNGCIENAKSLTQGGCDVVVASLMMLGITNVIDSLIVVKQFVYEEKLLSMKELVAAVQDNWKGHEDLRMLILKRGQFFGNDDVLSNGVARELYDSIYKYLKGKTNVFGYPIVLGDILGYNEHHKWFGNQTKATPDGRYDGDRLKFGIGQSDGKDRSGLTALLNSVAKVDSHAIACGSTATNISVDEQMVQNDDNFEKLVRMFETYFRNGGAHFQLTYVSREELLAAREKPEEHSGLRVRVTGFSEYFSRLQESVQDDIIERTSHQGD